MSFLRQIKIQIDEPNGNSSLIPCQTIPIKLGAPGRGVCGAFAEPTFGS